MSLIKLKAHRPGPMQRARRERGLKRCFSVVYIVCWWVGLWRRVNFVNKFLGDVHPKFNCLLDDTRLTHTPLLLSFVRHSFVHWKQIPVAQISEEFSEFLRDLLASSHQWVVAWYVFVLCHARRVAS